MLKANWQQTPIIPITHIPIHGNKCYTHNTFSHNKNPLPLPPSPPNKRQKEQQQKKNSNKMNKKLEEKYQKLIFHFHFFSKDID